MEESNRQRDENLRRGKRFSKTKSAVTAASVEFEDTVVLIERPEEHVSFCIRLFYSS
jgi:hypothetical protein